MVTKYLIMNPLTKYTKIHIALCSEICYINIMYNGNKKALDRFLNGRAEVGSEDECWLWKGAIDKKLGYGRSGYLGKPTITAHRITYILAYGDYLRFINGNGGIMKQ